MGAMGSPLGARLGYKLAFSGQKATKACNVGLFSGMIKCYNKSMISLMSLVFSFTDCTKENMLFANYLTISK